MKYRYKGQIITASSKEEAIVLANNLKLFYEKVKIKDVEIPAYISDKEVLKRIDLLTEKQKQELVDNFKKEGGELAFFDDPDDENIKEVNLCYPNAKNTAYSYDYKVKIPASWKVTAQDNSIFPKELRDKLSKNIKCEIRVLDEDDNYAHYSISLPHILLGNKSNYLVSKIFILYYGNKFEVRLVSVGARCSRKVAESVTTRKTVQEVTELVKKIVPYWNKTAKESEELAKNIISNFD